MRLKLTLAVILLHGLALISAARAQDQTAYQTANCNASFLDACQAVAEAPGPIPGAGLGGAMILLGAVLWLRRQRSQG